MAAGLPLQPILVFMLWDHHGGIPVMCSWAKGEVALTQDTFPPLGIPEETGRWRMKLRLFLEASPCDLHWSLRMPGSQKEQAGEGGSAGVGSPRDWSGLVSGCF